MFLRSFAQGIPLTAALLSLGASAPVQAGDFNDRGLYVSLGGTYTSSLFQDEVLSYGNLPSDVAKVSDSKGLSARIGYRAMSWIALEIQYEWLDAVAFSNPALGPFAQYEPQTVTANLKLIFPGGRIQPYLLAGAGVDFWKLETFSFPAAVPAVTGVQSSGKGFTGRAGLGLNFHLTNHLALAAEGVAVLNTTTLDPTETNLDQPIGNLYYFAFSAGLSYRF